MQHETRIIDADKGIVQVTTDDERFYSRTVEGETIWIPSVTWIADYLPKGIEFYKWLAKNGWEESQAMKESAGERGTMVHNACEKLLKGESIAYNSVINDRELTTDEYTAVLSFKKWYDAYEPEVEKVETTVFSPDNRYAGTMDLMCLIGGNRYIIDLKTSANVWPSHIIQVSAYKHAVDVEVDDLAILQLGYKRNKNGYKFTEVPDKFDLFNAAYKIWEDTMSGVSPLQKDLPLEITLKKESAT